MDVHPTRRAEPSAASERLSLRLGLVVAMVGACVWACTATEGRSLQSGDLGGAPPQTASRERAAAAGPSGFAASPAGGSLPASAASPAATPAPASPAAPPELLSATGLYVSPASRGADVAPAPRGADAGNGVARGAAVAGSLQLHPDVLQFVPQYPLWSDGATKRRFVRLPAGGQIDASKPDAWVFPVGTRFWKEFSFPAAAGGLRRVETRYLERRADGSWLFASYLWDDDGREARLVPAGGQRGVAPIQRAGQAAPAGAQQAGASLLHDIPSREDCLACHEGAGERAPVLGFTALQLSPDRDPGALHAEVQPVGAVDLDLLRARGLLVGAPGGSTVGASGPTGGAIGSTAGGIGGSANGTTGGTTDGPARPSIHAESPEARATLGYLHANCAGCHNRHGALADLELDFEQMGRPADVERVLASLVGVPSRFRLPGAEQSLRVVPGAPEESVLSFRIGSRHLVQQMPPIGSKVVDQEATKLVASWIAQLKSTTSHDVNENAAPSGARKEAP